MPYIHFKDGSKEPTESVVKRTMNMGVEKYLSRLNFQQKMEKKFEDEHPGKKAIWQKKMTRMFITWLKRNNQYNKYIENVKKS